MSPPPVCKVRWGLLVVLRTAGSPRHPHNQGTFFGGLACGWTTEHKKGRRDGFCDQCTKREKKCGIRDVPKELVRIIPHDAIEEITSSCQKTTIKLVGGKVVTINKRVVVTTERWEKHMQSVCVGDKHVLIVDHQEVGGNETSDRYAKGTARVPAKHFGKGASVVIVCETDKESAQLDDLFRDLLEITLWQVGSDVLFIFDSKRASMAPYCSILGCVVNATRRPQACQCCVESGPLKRPNLDNQRKRHLHDCELPEAKRTPQDRAKSVVPKTVPFVASVPVPIASVPIASVPIASVPITPVPIAPVPAAPLPQENELPDELPEEPTGRQECTSSPGTAISYEECHDDWILMSPPPQPTPHPDKHMPSPWCLGTQNIGSHSPPDSPQRPDNSDPLPSLPFDDLFDLRMLQSCFKIGLQKPSW